MGDVSQNERMEMARQRQEQAKFRQKMTDLVMHAGIVGLVFLALWFLRYFGQPRLIEQVVAYGVIALAALYYAALVLDLIQGRHVKMVHDAVKQSNEMYTPPAAAQAQQPANGNGGGADLASLMMLQFLKNNALLEADHRLKLERTETTEAMRRERPDPYSYGHTQFTVDMGGNNDRSTRHRGT